MEDGMKDGVLNESRRAMIGAGAVGVAALALNARLAQAQPDAAQPRSDVAKSDLTEREITYRSGDTNIRAFRAEPAIRPKAAIIIIRES
jgi:hypothetical protein